MGTVKFTISMPEEIVGEIDALADELGTTRSGVLQEASAEYIARRHDAAVHAEREARLKRAMRLMEEVRRAPDLEPGKPIEETRRELRDERERGASGEPRARRACGDESDD